VPDGPWANDDADLAALLGPGPAATEASAAEASALGMARHDWRHEAVDLAGYAESGLPAQTMGRSLAEDPLFFAAALAGGGVLARLAGRAAGGNRPEREQEVP
jgi:hypothetical protein